MLCPVAAAPVKKFIPIFLISLCQVLKCYNKAKKAQLSQPVLTVGVFHPSEEEM